MPTQVNQDDHWVKELRNISRPPPHPPSQHHHRTPNGSRTIQHSTQRGQQPARTIKEAMFICIQDPALNRNLGKYQLPHIWDHLFLLLPTLQCKPSNLPTTPHPLTPYWFPHTPPTVHTGGGTYFYGKYTCLSTIHP